MQTTNISSKFRYFISCIRLPWLLFTLLVFMLLVKLGLWQSARAIEKRQRLQHIEQLKTHNALNLSQVLTLLNTEHSNEAINDLPLELTVTFLPNYVFLLDNQTFKNQLGYRVFQVAHANNNYVLINLGWVVGSINRQQLPNITALTGKHTIKGNLRVMEKGVLLQEQKFTQPSWPLRVQQIELDKFSSLIGEKLLPFVVYLDKNESLGFEKNWHPIVIPPEKHQAYAFQWFSLAVAWLMLMAWAALKHNNNNNKESAVE